MVARPRDKPTKYTKNIHKITTRAQGNQLAGDKFTTRNKQRSIASICDLMQILYFHSCSTISIVVVQYNKCIIVFLQT